MQETVRLFVAAALPAALKAYLATQLQPYQQEALRFVPEQNLHLTLFFIGNVPAGALPDVKEKIRIAAASHTAFELALHCLEPGPNPRSPRLLWARFAQNSNFEELNRHLTQQLALQPPKQQNPVPHVTLARFRKDKPLPTALPTLLPETPVQLPVNAVALWQSELASPHPRYSILESYPLS
ncbi:RNA 2',3'-cyclic phosphodiesterase [Pontibacter qinzhouensis]|uniref:RNA 2',3'-cyclic phosphodiesterase n=1 Tax=Pontibacter qinzhouensis TaxID=2603253 RepID=A0A5C8KEX9_9BACT|nr:RNA 2',3'-cyclic phosphodiesterase [Pontibacter qinzhouensis]TXK52070.1 RNA 2',3'-cyclic phosphodiesterase [Pontibacter qinzhouensis]